MGPQNVVDTEVGVCDTSNRRETETKTQTLHRHIGSVVDADIVGKIQNTVLHTEVWTALITQPRHLVGL